MKVAIFGLEALYSQTMQVIRMSNWNKAMILKSKGTQIIVVSNQIAVAEEKKSIHLVMVEMLKLTHMLRADLLLFCPDEGRSCWEIDPYLPKTGIFRHTSQMPMFRMPQAGMLLRGLATVTRDDSIMEGHKHDMKSIDYKNFDNSKHQVFYCGEDSAAAEALNIRFIHTRDFANDKTTKGKLG